MKVTIEQKLHEENVSMDSVHFQCHNCLSVLTIDKADLTVNADRHGTWYTVTCQCCGALTGVGSKVARCLGVKTFD